MSNRESLEFHIKSGDYFGTLATVISLIYQNERSGIDNLEGLNVLVDDLIYLQNNYDIISK